MNYIKRVICLLILLIAVVTSGCDKLPKGDQVIRYDIDELEYEDGWAKIDDDIIVITDESSSEVNMTLLIDSGKAALIDTGSEKSKKKVDEIIQYLLDKDLILTDLFITHGHQDHTGNVDSLISNNTTVHKYSNKEDGEIINFGNKELKVIYTPGHTFDHMSIELIKEHILIAGDVLVTNGLPALGENSFDLISTLEMMRQNRYALIVPGHGYIIDSELALNRHLDYLTSIGTFVKEAIALGKASSDLKDIDVWQCINLDDSLKEEYYTDGHNFILQKIYYEIIYGLEGK